MTKSTEQSDQGGNAERGVAPAPAAQTPSQERTAERSAGAPSFAVAIAVYSLLRIGLTAALTVAIMGLTELIADMQMPLIVALAFALVVQLPLSFVLFRRPRNTLTLALAQKKERRTAERDRLHAELAGEALPAEQQPGE